MIDAPIPAEYWVGEMITIKKELVKEYAGRRKIVVAGGSSTLFGIDADYATKQLKIPVINFGLHASLRLEKILREVSLVVEQGDLLILPLEGKYYDCNENLNSWQVDNIIGWDHDAWMKMNFYEKVEFVTLVSPITLMKMFVGSVQRKFFPSLIHDRLRSLDKSEILSKFRNRTSPLVFEYSAYNLNSHGDIQKNEGAKFRGMGDVTGPNHVCPTTAAQINNFVENMKQKGVTVYFANTPIIASTIAKIEVKKSELSFQQDFINIGCFIDKREELVLDRKYFFNTSLHLNSEGRAIRTKLFINSIRNNVINGRCKNPSES